MSEELLKQFGLEIGQKVLYVHAIDDVSWYIELALLAIRHMGG